MELKGSMTTTENHPLASSFLLRLIPDYRDITLCQLSECQNPKNNTSKPASSNI